LYGTETCTNNATISSLNLLVLCVNIDIGNKITVSILVTINKMTVS